MPLVEGKLLILPKEVSCAVIAQPKCSLVLRLDFLNKNNPLEKGNNK